MLHLMMQQIIQFKTIGSEHILTLAHSRLEVANMSMCNFCKVRQAWLLEAGNGCCAQVVCDCLEHGEVDSSCLDDFELALVQKWIPSENVAKMSNPKPRVSKPRCNLCQWKQAWLFEHGVEGSVTCRCLQNEEEDTTYVLDPSEKALIEKWILSTNDTIHDNK